jgi:hypothetical protein
MERGQAQRQLCRGSASRRVGWCAVEGEDTTTGRARSLGSVLSPEHLLALFPLNCTMILVLIQRDVNSDRCVKVESMIPVDLQTPPSRGNPS